MKKSFYLLVSIFVFVTATVSLANVMPFNITVDDSGENGIICYRLNEACSAVAVNIYGPLPDTTVRVTLPGTTNFGLNTVIWDRTGTGVETGNTFGISVVATDSVGHSAWTKISNDSTSTFTFSYARGGCRVNKNQGSPYFGLIYNSCCYYSPSAAFGIVPIYPDGSDPFGVATTGLRGNIPWSRVGTSVSPWHTFIGTDDKVWIADYSVTNSGIWRAESGDLSGTWTPIFDTTNRDASTGFSTGLYGNIISLLVEGTGTTTVLYTIDQDLPSGYANNGTDPQLSSVWKYDVGEGPFPCSTPPTVWINDSSFTATPGLAGYGVLVDAGNGATASPIGSQTLAKDSLGRWWVSNYQYTGTNLPTIVVFSPDRQTIVWDSRQIGTGGGTDPLFADCAGFVIDEKRNRVITAPYYVYNAANSGFTVFPFDPLPIGNLNSVATTIPITSCTPRQLDIDAAGNLYLHDTQHSKLYIYSPPDGPNSFTTKGSATIQNGVAFNVIPSGPITVSKGKTQTFSVEGGIAPFTWALSTTGVGSLDTTEGNSVIFTGDNGGTVDLTVTDSLSPTPVTLTVNITVNPTSAPIYKETAPRKYIRFELFE
ncbi:MAG: hypothetical protein ACE14V_11225 [bacterium]